MAGENEAGEAGARVADTHPKPLHRRDWRDILTELAIVVIGVGLALAAQQAADWWRWREQAQGARQAIAKELAFDIANGARRVTAAMCLEQRMDRIADVLDTASRSGMLPPLAERDVGSVRQDDWPTSAWDSVTSSEVVSHLSRDEINRLGLIYQQIQMLSRLNEQEKVIWSDLAAMIGPGRRLDPTMDTTLHLALTRARTLNRTVATNSAQVVERALALALPYDDDDRRQIALAAVIRGSCNFRPGIMATAVPPRYGQAAGSGSLATLRTYQKQPPYTQAK